MPSTSAPIVGVYGTSVNRVYGSSTQPAGVRGATFGPDLAKPLRASADGAAVGDGHRVSHGVGCRARWWCAGALATAARVVIRSWSSTSTVEGALAALAAPLPGGDGADEQRADLLDAVGAHAAGRSGNAAPSAFAARAVAGQRGQVGITAVVSGSQRMRSRKRPYQPLVSATTEVSGRTSAPTSASTSSVGGEVEQRVPALVDRAACGARTRRGRARPVAEVVLRRRVVALAGGGAHVAQRHRLQAALGEQLLGGLDQRPRGSARCGSAWPDTSTIYAT